MFFFKTEPLSGRAQKFAKIENKFEKYCGNPSSSSSKLSNNCNTHLQNNGVNFNANIVPTTSAGRKRSVPIFVCDVASDELTKRSRNEILAEPNQIDELARIR